MFEQSFNQNGKMIVEPAMGYGSVKQADGATKPIPLTTKRVTSLQMLASPQRKAECIAEGLEDTSHPDENRPCPELLEQRLSSLDGKDRAPT